MTDIPTGCQRCGKCCKYGGPTLHTQDCRLLDENLISRRDVVLLRPGEPVNDPVTGEIKILEEEIFKIRGRTESSWECKFFDSRDKSCTIYSFRPIQCALFQCWDTTDLKAIYQYNLLSRKNILSADSALWDLIQFHAQNCSLAEILSLMESAPSQKWSEQTRIREKIDFDQNFRQNFLEKTGCDPETISFYFGRPLLQILPLIQRYFQLCL